MDTEDEARKAWASPRRGDHRIDVTIDGSRVWVGCKGDVVRVVIQREDGGSQVETDLVRSVEVHTWKRGQIIHDSPPLDGEEAWTLMHPPPSSSGSTRRATRKSKGSST